VVTKWFTTPLLNTDHQRVIESNNGLTPNGQLWLTEPSSLAEHGLAPTSTRRVLQQRPTSHAQQTRLSPELTKHCQ
jgi:hypothetical protein